MRGILIVTVDKFVLDFGNAFSKLGVYNVVVYELQQILG